MSFVIPPRSRTPDVALAPGEGALVFARVAGRTVIESARAASPLKLLTPKNHGDGAWVYVASFGGGLVDGDVLSLTAHVRDEASALLATQASTKVYRSPNGCAQRLVARVDAGALFVALPDPVVCYAGSRYAQSIAIELGPGASIVLLDTFTCGRRAFGERWDFDRYASRIDVTRAGAPLLRESVLLDPRHGAVAARMASIDALATLVAIGPRAHAVRDALLAAHGRRPAGSAGSDARGMTVVASPLGEEGEGAIARIAGESIEEVTRAARALLAEVPSLLGDDPFASRW